MTGPPKRQNLDENVQQVTELAHTGLHSNVNAILDYSNLYLKDDKCAEIVEKARLASVPTRLDLRGNCFEAGAACALAALLRSSHSVVSISLEWNNVGLMDQGVEALASALEIDKRLFTLDLRNNNITPEGARALAKALRANQTLRQLDLRWNGIGNSGALAFLEALQSNHSLLTLKLMGNNCSLRHVDEIELLLARNRALTVKSLPLTSDASCQNDNEDNSDNKSPRTSSDDQLLLQLLAEKEKLEEEVDQGRQERQKLLENIEELDVQLKNVRKDADMAKEDRVRYQQREIDAKSDFHELKMQLNELESRKKLELEEYRSARTALERENGVIREKTRQIETLQSKEREQKDMQIAQLEEAKYMLDNDIHRTSLTIRTQQNEIESLKKQLQEAQQDYVRKEVKLVSEHDSNLRAAERQLELVIGSIQTQLKYTSSQLETSERSVRELKEKSENLQAKILQSQFEHEKVIGELKQQWELEVQERTQRSVGLVEGQVAEVKKARQHLEQEVAQKIETIIQLRQDNAKLQQAKDEMQREMNASITTQTKALVEKQTLLAAAVSERTRVEEKLQLQLRKMKDQDAKLVQMQTTFDERIQDLTSSAKVATVENATILEEKTATIAHLECEVLQLERTLSAQNHEHEMRIDDLAESFGRFVQERIAKERERRKKVSADACSQANSPHQIEK